MERITSNLSNNNRRCNSQNDALVAVTSRVNEFAEAYQGGKLDLHDAVDRAQDFAETRGFVDILGQDKVQSIMATAFARRAQP